MRYGKIGKYVNFWTPGTREFKAIEPGDMFLFKLHNKKSIGENGIVTVPIENKKGFTLPGTGGMGTYIFTIGGLVVMAGAVLLLVSSKKKRA